MIGPIGEPRDQPGERAVDQLLRPVDGMESDAKVHKVNLNLSPPTEGQLPDDEHRRWRGEPAWGSEAPAG